MFKNLMKKRINRESSLSVPYEGNKRQTASNEDFDRFIHTCKQELRETNQCICFTLDQIKYLLNYYGDNNISITPVDFYYVIKPKRYVIVCLNGITKRVPITSPIDLRWEVISYE